MTREELAKAIREDYERKGVWACKSTTINMRLDFEMLGIILEALEQEPILDKIRAEIEQDAFRDVSGSKYIFINRINQIIDKYKGESEEK